jgi:hypothetical protein
VHLAPALGARAAGRADEGELGGQIGAHGRPYQFILDGVSDGERLRERLAEKFAQAVARVASGRCLSRAPSSLRLPAALRESIVAAARFADPEALIDYYTERMPELLVEQLACDGAVGELLARRLELSRLPRLRAALDGLWARLAEAAVDGGGEALTGAASPAALIAARPSLNALYAESLFGSGLPFVGAYPDARMALARALEDGGDPEALVDLRLAGHLVHELCHGLPREAPEPVPWLVAEAAALHLGWAAHAAHVLPDEPGEAVPGVARFVLVGAALARSFGARALWGLSCGLSTERAFGAAVAAALATAEWQAWRRRPEAPFARDALRALDWVKLIDAARGGGQLDGELLDAAAAQPWPSLPWWAEEASAADLGLVGLAVDAQFHVNCMAPGFATLPSEPPGARLLLDVEACTLSAAARSDGVFAEPATALFPPSLARRLHARGARRIAITGVARARRAALAQRLCELAQGGGALAREQTVDAP